MAAYDSVDLLARLRAMLRRPTSDESLTDAQAYQLLADAQQALYEDVAVRAPNAFLSAPATLTTSDNKVFTFGTDAASNAIVPLGNTLIYPNLASIPDYPWKKGFDFLDEGSQIRIPNDRTYSGTLYYRGVIPPAPISASSAPTMKPAADRVLLVYWAAGEYAGWGDLRDPSSYLTKYQSGVARLLLRLKRGMSTASYSSVAPPSVL